MVDSTPFARDILRELAEAVRAAGMRLYVYYSPLDWSHTYHPKPSAPRAARLCATPP